MSGFMIPKTQHAVVFDEVSGPIMFKNDWPVTQASELKPGEGE